ncbi:hypothetical protein AB0M95_24950 [Sphaerisporangium sp. NPDC051017]|uniref:hypothetical protein n=1 Tax=Sphaerisporangium sp. NPDC051017 TaxID=3154636 RepID=UPI003433135C
MGVREIRDHPRRCIDIACFTGEPAIAERHGEPRAVLVRHAWRIERHNHLDSAG